MLALLTGCESGLIRRDTHGRGLLTNDFDVPLPLIRKKLTILSFFNESPFGGQELAHVATKELENEIKRTREYILDNTGESLFGDSKQIYVGGGLKLTQLARKAKMSGIHFVLFGRIKEARIRENADEIGFVRKSKSFTFAKMEIKIFDVIANKEIFSQEFLGQAKDSRFRFFMTQGEEEIDYRLGLLKYATRLGVRKSIPKILEISQRLSWTGRVARIIGTKIYVNAGRNSGIQIGDILKVMTEGEEIYDPQTGALLGNAKGEVKGTLEVVEYFGTDGAISLLHSGGSVNEGDFVQLY